MHKNYLNRTFQDYLTIWFSENRRPQRKRPRKSYELDDGDYYDGNARWDEEDHVDQPRPSRARKRVDRFSVDKSSQSSKSRSARSSPKKYNYSEEEEEEPLEILPPRRQRKNVSSNCESESDYEPWNFKKKVKNLYLPKSSLILLYCLEIYK